MQKAEKEQIIQLISLWRERSNLTVKQIVARVQAQGCDLSRAMFENRFIRYDVQPDIAPMLTLAVIAAFRQNLTPPERCTAREAIELAKLTHLPIDHFEKLRPLFDEDEFNAAYARYSPNGLGPTTVNREEKAPGPAAPPPLHFPGKAYHRLIGRSQELDHLLALLSDTDRKPIIAVVGLGGIGKTTLAQEAMEACWQDGLFEHIVWASAKTERFIGEGIRKTEVSDFSLEQLLDEIGRQCNRLDIAKLPLDQKRAAVKHLLTSKRVLVVMDNLETVSESESFVEALFQLLGPTSKLLLTSRHQVRHERTFTLDLSGLFEAEALTFLREDSEERGIDIVAQASLDDLTEIYHVTGGAPLAMKLVIGQMSRWPLRRVLDNLKAASSAGPNYDFYHFIFKQSWDILSLEAKQTLVSMAVFDLANGCTEASLAPVCRLPADTLQLALDHLILLSLVDTFGDLTARRYTLHSLTHYFILSDIVKKWG